ncbi:LPS export ABC transporter periplasmic protein LptC [Draconibacterium halophilum]|uniref:LPS export ABC transporter periplasmic protein LptC n=1 Tax=Draconibacterium halophilum TaxID=2706887 RepID=A0A6C0RIA5_9BACT|nr:LPS export ABC transporter periplasmic protein LptC [Draconibacterium halophilum]QIA09817.1 LPS export ABC transporter periplasmic protein LptC [Draconibacterium halophilum]
MKTQKFASKILRLIKTFRIAVLVLGTAILFFACKKNDIEKIKAFSTPENLPVLEATNFETLSTDSGTVRFSLKADRLLRFENDGKTFHEFPEGLLLIKYDENQKIISSIKADYAKEFIKEEKWEAKNNVIVTNENGDSLKTEHLIWDEKNETIFTEEYVKIISADKIITGTGLTSDQNMQNWKIKNPKGVIYVAVDNENQPGQTGNTSKNPAASPDDPVLSKEPPREQLKFN